MSYSDDIYSASAPDSDPMDDPLRGPADEEVDDDDDDVHQVLSPTDGYFRRSGEVPSPHIRDSWQPSAASYTGAGAASSNVPHVPDVWVSDPSLEQGSTAESKAREAREERESNRRLYGSPPTTHSPGATYPGAALNQANVSPTIPQHTRSSSGIGSNRPSHHRYTPSSTSYASRSGRSGTFSSDRSFYSTPNDAPPAYTPGPHSPLTSTSHTTSRGYSTFFQSPGTMGNQSEETQGLLASEPQSMADRGTGQGEGPSSWRNRMTRWRSFVNWRTVRLAFLIIVLLGVTIGFLVSSITSIHREGTTPLNPPGNKSPSGDGDGNGNGGGGGGDGGNVDAPVEAPIHYPAYDDDLSWDKSDFCGGGQIKGSEIHWEVNFSARHSLTVKQVVQNDDSSYNHDVRVSGDVVVRRSGPDTANGIIVIETLMNDPRLDPTVEWDLDQQILKIATPRGVPSYNNGQSPCLRIRVTIWVPAGAELNDLNVENLHLGVKLLDNLSLRLTGNAFFESTVGHITAAIDPNNSVVKAIRDGAPATFQFDSRTIRVQTTSTWITGSWPLYDLLSLESISGGIKAHVVPKAVSQEKPAPANLYVKSMSGSVEVWESVAYAQQQFVQQQKAGERTDGIDAESIVPPRDYQVDISSTSGTLKGAVAISSSTRIHSTSASISFDLLPVLDKTLIYGEDNMRAELETTTTSGTTTLSIREPLWVDLDRYTYLRYPTAPSPVPREPDYIPVGGGDPYDLIPTRDGPVIEPAIPEVPSSPGALRHKNQPDAGAYRALHSLYTRHSSTSASIKLVYPRAWEGDFDIKTISGSVNVHGKGIVVRSNASWPPVNKHVQGHKGKEEGGSQIDVNTISGSVNVLIGDP